MSNTRIDDQPQKGATDRPSDEQIVSCLRSDPYQVWRPNLSDPYIYLSFSLGKLRNGYLNQHIKTIKDNIAKTMAEIQSLAEKTKEPSALLTQIKTLRSELSDLLLEGGDSVKLSELIQGTFSQEATLLASIEKIAQKIKENEEKLLALKKDLELLQSLKPLQKPVMKRFQEDIMKEWGERAGLPIKILPLNTSVSEILTKNVYFLTASPLQTDGAITKVFNAYGLQSFKVGIFFDYSLETLDNEALYQNLHEAGHAIPELKHAYKYHAHEPETCYPADCTHTVMAYPDRHCQPFEKKLLDLAAQLQIDKVKALQLDSYEGLSFNLEFTPEIFAQSKAAIPTELQFGDLLAAEDFKRSWSERNQQAIIEINADVDAENTVVFTSTAILNIEMQNPDMAAETILESSGNQNSTPTIYRYLSDYVSARFNEGLTAITNATLNYVKQLSDDCPGYFPPTDVTVHPPKTADEVIASLSEATDDLALTSSRSGITFATQHMTLFAQQHHVPRALPAPAAPRCVL